jgi:hypothetical protein
MNGARYSSAEYSTGRLVGKPYLSGLCQGCPFLSGVEFRPQSRLGRVSKDGSFESDDLMFWEVRPGLCRDVVPLAQQSFELLSIAPSLMQNLAVVVVNINPKIQLVIAGSQI